ncbi:MAG: S-layer homology domain-containing protein [Lachnospiraceae bacterium]|nr:S-layer homology domain-containing protein [Lachnospiraceae bacterium]
MKKRFIRTLLAMCMMLSLLVGLLPAEAMAFAGSIYPAKDVGGTVQQIKQQDGSLVLQNDYIRVTLHQDGKSGGAYLTTSPTEAAGGELTRQTPYCTITTYRYGVESVESMDMLLKQAEYVKKTPQGNAPAIKATYTLRAGTKVDATVTAYYELVQLKDDTSGSGQATWGVLTTVSDVFINNISSGTLWGDPLFTWGYTLSGFTAMGHNANLETQNGPTVKLRRITVPEGENPTITSESVTLTAPVKDIHTRTVPKGYYQSGDLDGVYITEAYVDGYSWANPFVGLSEYYAKDITSTAGERIKVNLPPFADVQPNGKPQTTSVLCKSNTGMAFEKENIDEDAMHFLWGYRDLVDKSENLPTEPDKVDTSITAKRLAVFSGGSGVTVKYVADDTALAELKKQYGNPVALINGDYESTDGSSFIFTGGAALLSPSVTATWPKDGKLIIHSDGKVVQSGVHLSAPTFKFYKPKSGANDSLSISLKKEGFVFDIAPEKNDALIYVDIPYTKVKLKKAAADASGNLIFSGDIGFRTVLDGAEFSLEKLGYGLKEKNVNGKKTYGFQLNGVHATGSFDTATMLALELAKVKGEVNTFEGEERYAFELELNVFDLFETEANLALERANNGVLIPDELYFYVASSPGIVLIPPVPVGQLNGGGAGFKDLAATVNGNYFGIPPIKLRGTLKGTYLHLVEGKGDVIIGPSEFTLKASEVGLVGSPNVKVIKSFGYSLKVNGQKRNYKGVEYQGFYFSGSEELEAALPSTEIDILDLNTSMEMGAFGGVNNAKDRLYLGIGANGIVKGAVQIPEKTKWIGGTKLASTDINLIMGGQTTVPIQGTTVNESMKEAFKNVDIYLGAMAGVYVYIFDARVWVLVPQIVETNFKQGGGWDIEMKWLKKLPKWNWEDHGVTPVVQSASLMSEEPDLLHSLPIEDEEEAGEDTGTGQSTREGQESSEGTGTEQGTSGEQGSGEGSGTGQGTSGEQESSESTVSEQSLPQENNAVTVSVQSAPQENTEAAAPVMRALQANNEAAVPVISTSQANIEGGGTAQGTSQENTEGGGTPQSTSQENTEGGGTAQGTPQENTEGSGTTQGSSQENAGGSGSAQGTPQENTEGTGTPQENTGTTGSAEGTLSEDDEKTGALQTEEPVVLGNRGGAVTKEITVNAGADETPYILLAFDNSLTEEEIKQALKVQKDGTELRVNWVGEDRKINPAADINAASTGDMKKTKDDGNYYRLVLLRLKEGGTYSVNTGTLSFSDEEGFTVEPFEKLELTQNTNNLTGKVKYPENGKTYVLRTYLGSTEGDAAYLVDEQTVTDTDNLSVSLPDSGELLPTGTYYATSFLMTEKDFILEGGEKVTTLAAIDHQKFNAPIYYTNTMQPDAPLTATLEFIGNEVMHAEWEPVAGADGYHVTIYQKDGTDWKDTGFGYDLGADRNTIDMALTVGGSAVSFNGEGEAASAPAENLTAGKDYKIGVRAYKEKTIEKGKGKYYSSETSSNEENLPKYTPLNILLAVNGADCTRDANGVFQAYVGEKTNTLTVTCGEAERIQVTRMDTDQKLTGDGNNTFTIPDFTGSLMLCVSGIKGKDVTSEFLLVNMDKTDPVLTLTSPIFFANRSTGAYTITGMTEAGSEVVYDNGSVYAESDGSFAITGTLPEREADSSLFLYAKDDADNRSTPQLAMISRQTAPDPVNENTGIPSQPENSGTASAAHTDSGTNNGAGTAPASPFSATPGSEPAQGIKPGAENTRRTTPKDGILLREWQDVRDTTTITDDQPAVDEEAEEGNNPFTDVSEDDWFYDDVMFVYENGLMEGISSTQFGPYETQTRGRMAEILWRMEGSPASKAKNSFADVEDGARYADAIAWIAENDILSGYNKDSFGPGDPITWEQLAVMFYRYAQYKGYDISIKGSQDELKDMDSTMDDAGKAVLWAVSNGLIREEADVLSALQDPVSRAEIAAMLHRFIDKYKLVQGMTPNGQMGWITPEEMNPSQTDRSRVPGWIGISLCAALTGGFVLFMLWFRRRRRVM